jgi:signal transduction histidine kinase
MIEIAQSVVEKYKTKAVEKDIHLRLAPSPGLPPVSGDSKSLERALTALIDNAIKFSPKGGDVNVRLRDRGDQVIIDVEDHGIGIHKENLARIFDRFYHLERSGDDLFGGIGLGLAITKQVIEQHQGSLSVTSTPSRGSTFTIALKKWK